jgi:hypothetical protein
MRPARLDALLALQQAASGTEVELLQSPVLDSRAFEGGVNAIYAVQLENGLRGYFKPLGGVSEQVARQYGHDPAGTLINECATWQLAKALGPPYNRLVPACVWREFDGVWGTITGSLSHHADGEPWNLEHDSRQCQPAALFDALVAQQDRHPGNFLWSTEHRRLTLIDHGFTFARPGDRANLSYFVQWRHERDAAALASHEVQALQTLAEGQELQAVAGMLAADRLAALNARVDHMLHTQTLLTHGQFGGSAPGHPRSDRSIDEAVTEGIRLARVGSAQPVDQALGHPPPLPAAQPRPNSRTPSRRIQRRR